jgi:transposase
MNLRERKSGKYVGQTKITHKGRAQLRRVVTLLALPIVRGRELFGSYYAQKTDVQKMPGKKAMTAVGRKLVKMIWGLYQSSAAFDRDRVFQCESAYRHVA